MTKAEALDGYDPVAAGEQDERGIDLTLLRANLELSVRDRLLQAEASSNSVQWFLDAVTTARSGKNLSAP